VIVVFVGGFTVADTSWKIPIANKANTGKAKVKIINPIRFSVVINSCLKINDVLFIILGSSHFLD